MKKIIACLDIKDGRVVKGINFSDLSDAGDPVECARAYSAEGADELVFLDISATLENRGTTLELVKKVSAAAEIPFTVGGGVRNIDDIEALLSAGADKVSINSAAISDPALLRRAAEQFGREKIVCAVDVREIDEKYVLLVSGGTKSVDLDPVEWAKQIDALGAGEILLTSFDRDGKKSGYDLEITRRVAEAVNIPITASGGAGEFSHFYDVFQIPGVEAALAASLFHFGEMNIMELKKYLAEADGVSLG